MCTDADPPEFWRRTEPIARKRYRCEECGRMIQPGERYERVAGKWDGYFSTLLTCQHCQAARVWLEVACGGRFSYGALGEELDEHWDEYWSYRSMALGRLIIGVRRGWRDGADPVPDVEVVRASVPQLEAVS